MDISNIKPRKIEDVEKTFAELAKMIDDAEVSDDVVVNEIACIGFGLDNINPKMTDSQRKIWRAMGGRSLRKKRPNIGKAIYTTMTKVLEGTGCDH